MEKMTAVIAFLRECATKLTDLATELEKDDAAPVEVPEKKKKKKEPAPAAEPEKTYTFDEVRQKSREGHTSEVKDAIAKFGASTLSGVDPKDYPSLMEIVEGL